MEPPSGWRALDQSLFHGFYGVDLPQFPTELVTHVATRGGLWLLAGLGLLILGRGLNRRTGAAIVAGLVTHVLLLEGVIKHSVARTRPFTALGVSLRDSLVNPESYSFPSGHTAASFLGAWVLSARFPKWRIPLLTLAGLVGVSRIHLGAHYPTDVGAGAMFGLILGIAAVRVFRVTEIDEPPVEGDTRNFAN